MEKKRRRERTGDAIKNRTRANCNELESDLKNNREPELRKELEPQDPVFEGRELSLPSSRRFVGAGEAKGAGECAGGGQGARMTSGNDAGRRTLVGKRAKGCIDLKPPVAWLPIYPSLSLPCVQLSASLSLERPENEGKRQSLLRRRTSKTVGTSQ